LFVVTSIGNGSNGMDILQEGKDISTLLTASSSAGLL